MTLPFTYCILDNALWFYLGYIWFEYREKWNQYLAKHPFTWLYSVSLLLIAYYISKTGGVLYEPFIYIGIFSGCIATYCLALGISKVPAITESKLTQALLSTSMGLYLYAEPINYLLLRIVIELFSINILGSELGSVIIFAVRTVGVGLLAWLVASIFKRINLKSFY